MPLSGGGQSSVELSAAVPVRHWRFRVLGPFGRSLSKTEGRQWISRSAGDELMHIKTAARSPRPTSLSPRFSERSATLHLISALDPISALHPISALDLISLLIPRFLIPRRAPGHRSTRQLVRPT